MRLTCLLPFPCTEQALEQLKGPTLLLLFHSGASPLWKMTNQSWLDPQKEFGPVTLILTSLGSLCYLFLRSHMVLPEELHSLMPGADLLEQMF